MKFGKALGAFCLALILGACHGQGNGPTGSSPAIPIAVTAIDGRTGQPVDLGGLTAVTGQAMTISAQGFLSFRTMWLGSPLVLWPADVSLPAQYTRGIIYDRQDPGTLSRWPSSVVALTINPIGISGRGLAEVQTAADLVSRARPALPVTVGNGGGAVVNLSVDPGDSGFQVHPNAAAVTYQYQHNGVVTSARIVFRFPLSLDHFYIWENLRTALAHEMGHATGLSHLDPSGEQGIMAATSASYDYRDFTDREKLVMRLQYQRRPGTRLVGLTEDETVASSFSRDGWYLVACDF